MLTTPGQLLVNSVLPEEYRDHTRTLGQDEVDALMQRVALERPEKYREISHALVQLGRNAAFDEGSTITLDDLVPVVDKKPLLDLVRKQEAAIRKDRRLTPEQKDDAIATLYGEATKRITDETYKAAIGNNNPFAVQVKYRARGSKNALGAMLTSPGTYTDSNGKLVPIFINRSYAEGLAPHEYWAAGYGARLGVISTKLGTQKGGYLDKMMNATAIDQVVTTDDCGTSNGIPVSVDDQDNVGAVLQSPAGGFSAGTVITKQVLDQIREKGEDEIVIRSPITCGCKDGLCKKCVGIRENGRFPDIGYNVGVNAASALGERVTQGALNCIAEGTLVRMADGTAKPIERVEPGDKVFGSDFRGNIFETTVVARYDQGVQPAFRTVFISEVGTVDVTTTTEHPILAMHNGDGSYHMCRIGHDPTDLTVLVVPYRGYLAGDVEHTEFVAEPFNFRSVEAVGDKHMYDLEVECDEHIYLLANGIVCANTKHSGKNDALGSYIGFEGLKNMTTIPKAFDVKASVAGRDGKVTAIEPAPQGGQYVVLDDDRDDRIYVPGNLAPSVKVGDVLEAGDAVSTGMVSPADVVQYKGVGEGRRYFMNRFRQVFKESGYGVNRRNVEVMSRALINNVQVENPDSEGSGLPGDILRYSAWAAGYTPRSDSTHGPVDKTALGRYLEQPVLHYTIGTRVTPSVLKSLKRHKVDGLTTNAYPPGVVPHMVSIVDAPAYSGDWMARLGTSYLKERLLEDVQRGGHSELHSTNPVPSMAKGIELGKDIATKGLY